MMVVTVTKATSVVLLALLWPGSCVVATLDLLVPEEMGIGSSWLDSINPDLYAAPPQNGSVKSRVARQLVDFPDDAVMEFHFKFVIPYWTYGSAQSKGDYRFEVTYELPNQLLRRRRKRTVVNERNTLFSLLQDMLDKGGLDGHTCVLRAVCEVAERPLDEYGLLGEFLNLIFAVGYDGDDLGHYEYIEAEDYGRNHGDCWATFPECPVSMRSMLHDFLLNNALHESVEKA